MPAPEQQIQDVTLSKADIGRQVAVTAPGRPEWVGVITGWDEIGVIVAPTIQGDYAENVFPENLRWVM